MKVYKVELCIMDHDEIGPDDIKCTIENIKYPNRCIHPDVTSIKGVDIGEWDDDHPLNGTDTWQAVYVRLFPTDQKTIDALVKACEQAVLELRQRYHAHEGSAVDKATLRFIEAALALAKPKK